MSGIKMMDDSNVLFTRLGTAEGIKRESEDGSIGNTQAET
jgi:hypothetical protein